MDHILVAVDESDAGRWAVRAALDLAAATTGRVTVLRTVGAGQGQWGAASGAAALAVEPPEAHQVEVDRLRRWLEPELASVEPAPSVSLTITYGVPSIEICRYAEEAGAALVVLGRKRRSARTRLLIGDTADSVARRSRLPCLFVPGGARRPGRILAALDGTDRGLAVLVNARRLADATGAELRTVTVEPAKSGETSTAAVPPLARTMSLERRLGELLGPDHPGARLEVRRGGTVEQILAALDESGADTLALGYHRGGPAGIIEAGSTGRRLLHAAPESVLTVPL
jgi:nucleotide-binding universal stress UspA family protein